MPDMESREDCLAGNAYAFADWGADCARKTAGVGVDSAGDRRGCILGVRTRFARGFMCTYDSEPLEELEAPSSPGVAAASTRGGVGGCTTRMVGAADVDACEEETVTDDMDDAERDVANDTEREDEEGLRGMPGRGEPALFECREYE